jgi:16S rRNA C967 or C1407 C5-methylase (RsmB/RsmF family)/NOL1/NOP2/fmu family ribosome biogenesis protein
MLPPAFTQQMKEILHEDFIHFETSLQTVPPVSIRFNPKKAIARSNFEIDAPIKWHSEGFYLTERPSFTLDPLFHAGAYYVQEASSMFIAEALRQTVDCAKKLTAIDLCAAPGGKTTLLASLFSDESTIVANEVIKSRVPVLLENVQKWGHPNLIVSNHDTEELLGLRDFFDVVVTDAPCSGEGLFRKDPNAMKEWSPESVTMCAARQQRILTNAAQLVKEGGILLYSTCTYNAQENQNNVKWLISQGFDYVKLTIPEDWGIEETTFGYQFFPHRTRGEGFFLACLRKTAPSIAENDFKKTNPPRIKKLAPAKEKLLTNWFSKDYELDFFEKPTGELSFFPKNITENYHTIAAQLMRLSSGTEAGIFKGNDFVPSHALALSAAVSPTIAGLEVDKTTALHFLKKENIDTQAAKNGWVAIRHEGLNLGWAKIIGNRMNNYLPKDWRIRMEVG